MTDPMSAAEVDAVNSLITAARRFVNTCDEFWPKDPDAIEDALANVFFAVETAVEAFEELSDEKRDS